MYIVNSFKTLHYTNDFMHSAKRKAYKINKTKSDNNIKKRMEKINA